MGLPLVSLVPLVSLELSEHNLCALPEFELVMMLILFEHEI